MATTYPSGYNNQRLTIEQIREKYFQTLDPAFAAQLEQLIVAGAGQIGVGGGSRSTEEQTAMFLSRYYKSSSGTVSWNGSRWKKKDGVAPAAPPGRSYHEPTTANGMALAVDLVGPGVNNGWLAKNVAQFGLRDFANVNNEPWHVQPAHIPTGRSSYGGSGPSGSGPTASQVPTPTSPIASSPGGSMTATASPTGGPFTLPSDAQLYNNGYTVMAVFDVGGLKVAYGVNWHDGSVQFDRSAVTKVSAAEWAAMNVVDAGNAEELRTIGFGSYREFYDKIVGEVMGYNNPARNDPGVQRVLAEFAGRPDMTPQEFNNKLEATEWFQTHTSDQLVWNGLAEAEKAKRREEVIVQMTGAWFQFGGVQVGGTDPRIANYLEDVASGKMGIGAYGEIVKQQALADGESPWSRTIRDEDEERLQRGVDIENTANRTRDLARRWGLQWTPATATEWATKIAEKKASEADVLDEMKKQAQVLYPWKSPDVETQTAAAPWIETYNRVLEKNGDLFDPKVQSALTNGEPVWSFEQQLKRSSEWMETKNARESMMTAVGNVGRMMGY